MIGMRVRVTEKGLGVAALLKEIDGRIKIKLGIFGEKAMAAHPGGGTVGEMAVRHEYGLGVPRRSAVLAWIDANEKRMRQETLYVYRRHGLKDRRGLRRAMLIKARKWGAEMQERIRSGQVKPGLAASTKAKKGHDIPLLETATLVNSIDYRLTIAAAKGQPEQALEGRPLPAMAPPTVALVGGTLAHRNKARIRAGASGGGGARRPSKPKGPPAGKGRNGRRARRQLGRSSEGRWVLSMIRKIVRIAAGGKLGGAYSGFKAAGRGKQGYTRNHGATGVRKKGKTGRAGR